MNLALVVSYILSFFLIVISQTREIKTGAGRKSKRRVALILSDNLPGLRDRFEDWNVIESGERFPSYADFIYADGFYIHSAKFHRIPSVLKPRLDARAIFDKTPLHRILGKSAPDTICKSVIVTPGLKIPPDAVWILKANWGWSGKGNRIVTNQEEMDKAIVELSIPQVEVGTARESDREIVASEYIRDPILYHGYKFHIRVHVIVLVTEKSKKVWIKNTGLIAPTAEKYIDGDYKNTNIHDSHFGKNPKMIGAFPRDLPNGDMYPINKTITDAFICLLPHINKYPETRAQYDNYAVDIMLTREGTPKILEINRFPGSAKEEKYKNDQVDFEAHGIEIFDSVLASAAGEVFKEFRTETNQKLITRLI